MFTLSRFGVPISLNQSFSLPLTDLGAGIVSLVPAYAIGSATPTFTRASVAWAKLSSGLWAQVATGIARSHYLGRDTAVGVYGGYLQEVAGTQLVTPTASIRGMNDASWIKVGITCPAPNATGIDGVLNSATTLTATGANSTILQTLTAAASVRNYSVFLRRKTGSGTILIQQGATTLDVTASLNSVTYSRVELNASVLNSAFGIKIVTSGDALEADFNQFEAAQPSLYATSPMATAGAARAADALTYDTAGNVDFTQGAAYAELCALWTASSAGAARPVFISTASLFSVANTAAATTTDIFDATTTVSKAGLTDMSTAVRKRASSWGAGGISVTGDGAAVANGAFDGSMGSGATLSIGGNWKGTIQNVRIFQAQVTSAQLQAMTA